LNEPSVDTSLGASLGFAELKEKTSSTSLDAFVSSAPVVSAAKDRLLYLLAGAALGLDSISPRYSGGDCTARYSASCAYEMPSSGLSAQVKSWLQKFWQYNGSSEEESEIRQYARRQVQSNLPEFSAVLRQIALSSAKGVPVSAVAQLLIDAADFADGSQSHLLGHSIEQYLDLDSPELVDAAARSLSPSRLSYFHAASRLRRAAGKTNLKFLRRKLNSISDQLTRSPDAEIRQEA